MVWQEQSEFSGLPMGMYSEDHMLRDTDPRHGLFVSCWHMSEFESIAMWKLYAGDMKGIALKSTVGKFRTQLPSEGRIRRVKYIDYGTDKTLHLSPAYCKRKAFEYEREIRAVIPNHDIKPAPAGIPLQIDLDTFIDEVRIAPDMPVWMSDLIQKLLKRYGVNAGCHRSSLDQLPQFDWQLDKA